MRTIIKIIGELLESLMGPSKTTAYLADVGHATEKITTTYGQGLITEVISKQYVYLTEYDRWFVPNRRRTVYEVSCNIPDEFRHLVDSRMLETVTYPMLSPTMLRWTAYPHMYAINTFLDRVHPGRPKDPIEIR